MSKFDFFFPIESLKKSLSEGSSEGEWVVRGVASAPNEDIQQEYLDPKGFITDNLKYFNYDHKSDPKYIVGEVRKWWIDELNRFWVEGIIYKTSEVGQQIVALANTLAKESKRQFKLGFSVEGSILKRDEFNPKRIVKAVVNSIAIAPFPVNATTWADILTKSVENHPIYTYDMESDNVITSCRMEDGKFVCIDKNKLIKSCYKNKELIPSLISKGKALPDGRFPIENESDLHKAIEMYNLIGEVNERAVRWFYKRAEDLKIEKAIVAGSITGTQTLNQESSGPGLKGEDLDEEIHNQVGSDDLVGEIREKIKKIKKRLESI